MKIFQDLYSQNEDPIVKKIKEYLCHNLFKIHLFHTTVIDISLTTY